MRRYALNWVKLRVWEWETEWDALLVIDADTTVTGDVVRRGVVMLVPCHNSFGTYNFLVLVQCYLL